MDRTEPVGPDYPDLAVTVECPLCGAAPGCKCVGQHGLIIHRARREAWQASRTRP